MGEGLRFEPFDKAIHHREKFDCGVEALNNYLKTKLGQHTRKGVTRGYVLTTGEGDVAGYFTLSAGRLVVSLIPDGQGFPPKVPLPTTLIGRLAVDRAFRGRGFGEILLLHALTLSVETAEIVASAVIEVDAKDEASRAFYAKYGFMSLRDDDLHMYLAMATARELVRKMA